MSEEKNNLSKAYASMMQMDAWRDLASFVDLEVSASLHNQDNRPLSELTLIEAAEQRGIRKGMRKVLRQAEFNREGV